MTDTPKALQRLDHISIIVTDVQDTLATYRKLLGLPKERTIFIGDVRDGEDLVTCGYIELENCTIEFCAPARSDGPFAQQLATRGTGLHHVAFTGEIDCDLDAEKQRIEDEGIRMIDKDLRTDDYGVRYAFVHPKDTYGALVCISDRTESDVLRAAEAHRTTLSE